MDPDRVAESIGELRSEVRAVNGRLDDHIATEELFQRDILKAVQEINETLSQATGAKRMLVWLLGLVFAAIALAKGWVPGR